MLNLAYFTNSSKSESFTIFGSMYNSPQQINYENFIICCVVGFRAILSQRLAFTTLDGKWITCLLFTHIHGWRHILRARVNKNSFVVVVYQRLLSHFIGLRLKHIQKWFNEIQVLKWFLLLPRVTCIILACGHYLSHFAHTTDTDVCASATESR